MDHRMARIRKQPSVLSTPALSKSWSPGSFPRLGRSFGVLHDERDAIYADVYNNKPNVGPWDIDRNNPFKYYGQFTDKDRQQEGGKKIHFRDFDRWHARKHDAAKKEVHIPAPEAVPPPLPEWEEVMRGDRDDEESAEEEEAVADLPIPDRNEEHDTAGAVHRDSHKTALQKAVASIRRLRQKADLEGEDEGGVRVCRAGYLALDANGLFGVLDAKESRGGCRMLVLHVSADGGVEQLDALKHGDRMEVVPVNKAGARRWLDVVYLTRHQYYAPGREVTTLMVGVPEWQWERVVGYEVSVS